MTLSLATAPPASSPAAGSTASEPNLLASLDITTIAQHLGDGMIITDGAGEILLFNAAAEKLFGYDQAEMLGRDLAILLPEEERTAHRKFVQNSDLYGSRIINKVRDLRGRRKDGTLFLLELNVARLDHNGAETLFIGVFRDISTRKQLEEQLLKESVAAERAVLSANIAEETYAAKMEFLAAMSHELRTPLNAILGFGQLMTDDHFGSISDVQKTYVDYILTAAKNLTKQVDDLLDLSRIEAGSLSAYPQIMDPEGIIQSTLEVARALGRDNGLTIRDERDQTLTADIVTDPVRFQQILLNLLSNAVKFNKRGGFVALHHERIGERFLRLLVTDTGIGINPSQSPYLFTTFHRLGAEKSEFAGAGIGLYLSRKLAEMMGGTMGFDSTPGEGSTFWVDLPLAPTGLAAASGNGEG